MAQTGYDRVQPAEDGDSNAKLPAQEARQGQNIKGMIWVLVIGTLLVVAAYAVMLAMQSDPVTPAQTPADGTPPPAAMQETP
jgi:hypothetical protein